MSPVPWPVKTKSQCYQGFFCASIHLFTPKGEGNLYFSATSLPLPCAQAKNVAFPQFTDFITLL